MTRFEGTFQGHTTGAEMGDIIQLGAIIGAGIGLALIIIEFAWLIITLGAVLVAFRLYLLHRKTEAIKFIAAKAELVRQEQAGLAAAALERRMRHELDVARAGATVIHNVIDTAPLVAAITAATRPQEPQWSAQPVPVIRGEVAK
jgi:hypothetical protein